MTTTDPPRTWTSPHDVRGKTFTVRLRGLDSDAVRFFMAGLADQLGWIQAQVATLTQENETLTQDNQLQHSELSEARAKPMEQATDQAVSVLNQAQQLADSLIDEAMEAARGLLLTARSQQRDIMEQAKVAAKGVSDGPQLSPNAAAARTLQSGTLSTSGCSPRWRRCSSRPCSMHSTSMSTSSVSCQESLELPGPAKTRVAEPR